MLQNSFMFTVETQLHEMNVVISNLAKHFAATVEHDTIYHLFTFQNILKRTTPGSRDEDTATKAFNELKKVVIINL